MSWAKEIDEYLVERTEAEVVDFSRMSHFRYTV
jgi:hypothetical protein